MKSFNRSIILTLFFALPAFAGSGIQGIRNFHQIDAHVYRGGQPTLDGYKYLARIGVKTVLDLRESNALSAAEQQAVTALGMKFVNVPMSGLTPPTRAQISQILSLLEGSSSGPVYVHCRRGADRTGAVIAAYRIDHDHWQNARALQEAMADHMAFFQWPRQNFIRNFQPLTLASAAVAGSGKTATTSVAAATVPATVAAPAAQ
ncbi:MAG TPA: sulfur transferase domain-containing protein [Terriglobia bacterium]|nr:sulfur transferase domain-containing protein [Terriglobia bacterium]